MDFKQEISPIVWFANDRSIGLGYSTTRLVFHQTASDILFPFDRVTYKHDKPICGRIRRNCGEGRGRGIYRFLRYIVECSLLHNLV